MFFKAERKQIKKSVGWTSKIHRLITNSDDVGDFHRPHITMIITYKTDFVKYERKIDMKKFASLTELEVLNLAYDSILRIKMEELRSEILSLEKKENK